MKKHAPLIFCIAAFAAAAALSARVSSLSYEALRLCAGLILPTLFPFFVLSTLLNRMGLPVLLGRLLTPVASRLFSVSGAGVSALAVGLCGGYPMGAAYIGDMLRSGHIDADEAERLLCFCNNSGPAFAISALGVGVFKSAGAGLIIYCAHVLAALVCAVLMRQRDYVPVKRAAVHIESMSFSQALPEAVEQSVRSVLRVCGFVVCFTVLAGLMDAGGLLSLVCGRAAELSHLPPSWWRGLVLGFMELGSCAGAMRGLSAQPINIALAGAALGWGGLSVHFQTRALLQGLNVKGSLHTPARLISCSLTALFSYALSLVFM